MNARATGPLSQAALIISPSSQTGHRILEQVAARHGLCSNLILGKCRSAEIVEARWEVFWRLRHELGWSYPRIGKFMNKDHSTAIHACQRMAARPQFAQILRQ